MGFNTLLLRLGISSDSFVNKENEPIPTSEGFIYEAEQTKERRECPFCRSRNIRITGYYHTETNCSELLRRVGDTFRKWRYEITNAFTKDAKRNRYTNAIAECINNQLKTIIKSAYGYHNFERFRKRAMLMIAYSKQDM
ncbi:MAG: transposase [Bacilli bacterium]|nr:transposase [Bacilli bacterium]